MSCAASLHAVPEPEQWRLIVGDHLFKKEKRMRKEQLGRLNREAWLCLKNCLLDILAHRAVVGAEREESCVALTHLSL